MITNRLERIMERRRIARRMWNTKLALGDMAAATVHVRWLNLWTAAMFHEAKAVKS